MADAQFHLKESREGINKTKQNKKIPRIILWANKIYFKKRRKKKKCKRKREKNEQTPFVAFLPTRQIKRPSHLRWSNGAKYMRYKTKENRTRVMHVSTAQPIVSSVYLRI